LKADLPDMSVSDFGDLPPTQFDLTIDWDAPRPAAACTSLPCFVCGGCYVCKDFHTYTGRGCTDETCPALKDRK
jgi:hypothetical protein